MRRGWKPGLHVLLVLLLVGPAAVAEVAVYDFAPAGTRGLYVHKIIDDSEPIPNGWTPFSSPSSERHVLNPDGAINGDGEPATLIHPGSGLALVAWSKNTGSGYDVVISRFENGAWTVEETLAGDPVDELDPRLTVDPDDGSVHVVYWVDDAWPRVMHTQAPADLSSWSTPVQVSDPAEYAVRPAAVFHAGKLYVVYEAHTLGPGGTPRQIVLATSEGSGYTTEVISATAYDEENRPEVHSAFGRLWIEWVDADNEMAWTRQLSTGTPWSPTLQERFSTLEEREYHVRGKIRALVME